MAYKKVMGSRTAEIQLDGSVYIVDFDCSYNYYAIRNDSDSTIYVSTTDKSCTPNNDGVVSIPSGGGYVHYNGFSGNPEIYVSGTGKVLVVAQDGGVCPFFKPAGKGGENGGTTDYDELGNKPTVGGATVEGNKTLFDYGLLEIVSDRTADSPENGIPTVGFVNAAVGGMASVIGSETDLNKLINSGTYVINGDLPQNFSGGYPWGILQVLNCAGNIVQIYYPNTNQGYSYRTKWFDTAAWKPWINT